MLDFPNLSLSINAMYRSPSADSVEFINSLDKYLNNCKSFTEVLIGDLNIDILKDDNYLNVISSQGF